MTLGEKIRYARKRTGLSQEQLAEKMCVSRSAIAKWETDKGLPDIENLKTLARLLCVSVDSLLDDSDDTESTVIREPCNLSAYGRGCSKVKKDRMMAERFPGARICSLHGSPLLSEEENIADSTLGILTPVPFGSPEFMKSVKDMDKDFYLVERDSQQFFVTVSDTSLEIRLFDQPLPEKNFHLGNWWFIRGPYLPAE